MATHDYVLANQSGSSFRTDLNNALAAVVSNNSNATEPTTKYAYELWADTNSGYLKIRNAANNAWVQLFKLDGTLSDIPIEGTVIKSTGESGGTKFLREDGDNSCSWQSISQTALTGSTNNTITTVTGANAIQGESNLTYNGNVVVNKSVGLAAGGTLTSYGFATHASSDLTDGQVQPMITASPNAANLYRARAGIAAVSVGGTAGMHLAFMTRDAADGSDLNFATDEKLRIKADGDVEIKDGDLVIGTSGHGIDFSAQTASSATGATSGAELLNHYEEGSWSPVLYKASVSGAVSGYAHQLGRYIRIGKMLWISFHLQKNTSSWGSGTGQWYIGGLPFNVESSATGAYQFIPLGYFGIDGTEVNQTTENARLQANGQGGDHATLTMYASGSKTNWTTGGFWLSASGYLEVD